MQLTGVRTPRRSAKPKGKKAIQIQFEQFSPPLITLAIPAPAAEKRRIAKPNPGIPAGNIVNIRCTLRV